MVIDLANDPPFGSIARQMNAHMGKMMDQMQKGYYGFAPAETWTPNVNLYENHTAYLVCVDLSGVEKDKIDVTVEGNRLTLKGHRRVPCCPDEQDTEEQQRRIRIHLMEIDHGSFSRQVELPEDVLSEKITATYRNGLLWIELPRK